jgi:penicillin amidase
LLLAGFFTGFIIVRKIKQSGMVDYNQDLKLPGLKEKVEVFRDQYGIPHVFAQNDEDLYRAVGYLSAEDRLWQMDLLRHVTTGRLSEIFGKDMIENDVVLRALRIPEKSRLVLSKSKPEVVNALKSYADGVNQYISDHENDLPFEFKILGYKPEKWIPEHSVNMIGYMAWDLRGGWSEEIFISKAKSKVDSAMYQELLPDFSKEETVVQPDFKFSGNINLENFTRCFDEIESLTPPVFSASNNWAVAGKKSTTGKPILCNDMHLGLSIPGVWSQIHEHSESGLDVTGLILPGQPCVIAGHNASIAWGMTNVMLDAVDFYQETINPENPNQYKFNGQWKDMEIRREKIIVKGEKESVVREIRFTHRGPVVSEIKNIKDKTLSIHWTGNGFSNELEGIYRLNRARNWNEFREGCKGFTAVSQNIIYADTAGNIGIQTSAGIPIRKSDGWHIFPGETDKFDWKGYVPFDSLPYTYNPECGYLFSANNKTVGNQYPHYISEWFYLPYRADRIKQMLTEKDKFSIDDMKTLQSDQKSLLAQNTVPVIFKSLENDKNLSETDKKCVDLFKNWNFVMDKNRPEPLIFEEFYMILVKNIAKDELGDALFADFESSSRQVSYLMNNIFKAGDSKWCDDITTKDKVENLSDMIQKSFSETVIKLTKLHGSNPESWKWGDVHKLELVQPLGKVAILDFLFNLNRTYSVGGSYNTVSPYSYNFIDPYNSDTGSSHRHIFSTADFDQSQTVIPTGVSGIPASPHYCDQTDMYVNGIYHADYTKRDLIEKNAKYKMTFSAK